MVLRFGKRTARDVKEPREIGVRFDEQNLQR
jgi:hypothetical protein